jgi:(1->4)-alpha-D-glucan 1-alpha-D-glucosylmutase
MLHRLKNNPLSINATATHDTKRGEDARVRINVLSEVPDEWEKLVNQWKEINKQYLTRGKDGCMPTANDEYFIYQTLIGVYPITGKQEDNLPERLKEYMIKVVREAKVNTSWAAPNEEYENAVIAFLESILEDDEFLYSLIPFMRSKRSRRESRTSTAYPSSSQRMKTGRSASRSTASPSSVTTSRASSERRSVIASCPSSSRTAV